jgi:hypothetical protein
VARPAARRAGTVVVGLCWATMYTAFMMALSFTTVANVSSRCR